MSRWCCRDWSAGRDLPGVRRAPAGTDLWSGGHGYRPAGTDMVRRARIYGVRGPRPPSIGGGGPHTPPAGRRAGAAATGERSCDTWVNGFCPARNQLGQKPRSRLGQKREASPGIKTDRPGPWGPGRPAEPGRSVVPREARATSELKRPRPPCRPARPGRSA